MSSDFRDTCANVALGGSVGGAAGSIIGLFLD